MNASLRTRLLLSYGLLIAVLLLVFSAGSLVGLLRNPLVYQSAAQQLRTAQRAANTNAEALASIASNPDPGRLEQVAHQLDVRIVLVSEDGTVLADSQADAAPPLQTQPLRFRLLAQRNEIAFVRDQSNRVWLTLVQSTGQRSYLALAVRRPRLIIFELMRSELSRPVMLSGIIGVALAVLVTIWLTRWITAPLKRIGQATEAVAAGNYQPIPLSGPEEARRLASSFNHMVRRVQDALQSQRDLVANVSHELKTPLTSIQGFSQAILDGVIQTPDEIQKAAGVICEEAGRMSRLAQDLVTLARLEAGGSGAQGELLEMDQLVNGVVEMFQPQADQAKVQLEAQLSDRLPAVKGDRDQLVQVVSNLVDNAVKYTPAGGRVTVWGGLRGRQVEIRVADSGPGIHPADRERVFQRFYRADRSKPGSGLGLAITRQIVLAHGGKIWVEENIPHGSVFLVHLPVAQAAPGSRR